jgi:hypothetical protein
MPPTLQNQILKLDIDFGVYMVGRWERTLVMLDSGDFSRRLVDAGRKD